jgi:hypothetical protein
MSAMSCCTSTGVQGRPRCRDFHRQKRRKRSRCHRTRVSGRTNRQELAPVDKRREQNECDSRGVVRAARSDLALDVTGKLFSEEEVFRRVAHGTGTSAAEAATSQREERTSFSARLPDHNGQRRDIIELTVASGRNDLLRRTTGFRCSKRLPGWDIDSERGARYSLRSASIGVTFSARRAGR